MTPMSTADRDDLPRDVITEVPEADAAEQATPAVPDTAEANNTRYPDDTGHTALPEEADPADAWEQALPVPGEDDDDYDHDGTADSRT